MNQHYSKPPCYLKQLVLEMKNFGKEFDLSKESYASVRGQPPNEWQCVIGADNLLRLRGGVGFQVQDVQEEDKPIKSPFRECRSIMDKLDQILAAYKSSLGPCGEATCPYSQSMMQETCREKCRSSKVIVEEPPKEDCEGDPCGNEECPYKIEKKRIEPGCGSASCAYSRYKLGLVDQDASLEYMLLPPAVSGKCGSPKCDYPLPPDLPPIHWDCPDPLPKGACKNPNCPHQPPELRKIKIRDPNKKICSCQDCPYAFPPPCGMPSCPFRENPCPFLLKQRELEERPSLGSCSKAEEVCSNPDCPFAPDAQGTAEIDDPKMKGEIATCSNPNCPFAKAKNKDEGKYRELCKNPDCPFNEGARTVSRPDSDDSPICPNPNCPFQKNNTTKAKRNYSPENNNSEECTKPEADCDEVQETCGNPECPYAKIDNDKESLCYYADENDDPNKRRNSRKSGSIVVENKIIVTNNDKSKKPDINSGEANKRKKKKSRGKFVYSIGNAYPGVKIGHKECVTEVFNVPPKMGWLWNIPPPIQRLKPRRGWRPGATPKTIAARIRAHRQAKGLGMLRVPKFADDRQEIDDDFSGRDVKVVPRPTLYIQKKEGVYSIVMNPLKDPKTLAENEDPYMECTPMRFKISPTKAKKTGSQTCFCDGEDEATSSSESELDIEFTPPAGIIHPERFKKKRNVIHCETQYNPLDIEQPKPEKKDDKKGGKKEKAEKKGKGGKGGKGGAKKGKK